MNEITLCFNYLGFLLSHLISTTIHQMTTTSFSYLLSPLFSAVHSYTGFLLGSFIWVSLIEEFILFLSQLLWIVLTVSLFLHYYLCGQSKMSQTFLSTKQFYNYPWLHAIRQWLIYSLSHLWVAYFSLCLWSFENDFDCFTNSIIKT